MVNSFQLSYQMFLCSKTGKGSSGYLKWNAFLTGEQSMLWSQTRLLALNQLLMVPETFVQFSSVEITPYALSGCKKQ